MTDHSRRDQIMRDLDWTPEATQRKAEVLHRVQPERYPTVACALYRDPGVIAVVAQIGTGFVVDDGHGRYAHVTEHGARPQLAASTFVERHGADMTDVTDHDGAAAAISTFKASRRQAFDPGQLGLDPPGE